MSLLSVLDAACTGPAVVYGSLPPEGRDIDLVVRAGDEGALAQALGELGFLRRGRQYARFVGRNVDAVEATPVDRWQLDGDEADAVFAEAVPLPGCTHLRRPAPHHVVLIGARRLASSGGALDDKRRARIDAAVAEDPAAWDTARGRASAWQASAAVALLEAAWRGRVEPTVAQRVEALAERSGRARAVRAVARRPRRGAVVAFSGLDGSGKSSQAAALRDALDRLGYEAVVEWTRLSYNPGLYRVLWPVKRALLPVAARLRGRRRPPASLDVDASRLRDPVKELRQTSPVLNWLWVVVMAVANVADQRRNTLPHIRRGRIVLCDRYTLDSAVHLRFRYGQTRQFRLQRGLLRTLSPRPVAAFYLDIPADVAYARKPEQYDLDQLTRQAALYREQHATDGVALLDGCRPVDELAQEIAATVWTRLMDAGGRGRGG